MKSIRFLPAIYVTIALLASVLFLSQIQNQKNLDTRKGLQNLTKVGAKNTNLTPWQEVSRKESPTTELLETIPVGIQEKVDMTPIQETGYVAGRKISVVPISKFPSIFDAYQGVINITNWNRTTFLTSLKGFSFIHDTDINWNHQYYADISPYITDGVKWTVKPKFTPDERIYLEGVRNVVVFTPPDNVAVVLDPFNNVYGRLQYVSVVPYQGKNKLIAFSRSNVYTNELYYYNFDEGIVRKWFTPLHQCGIYDDVGPVFTLSKDDEQANIAYALYDEKTVTGGCPAQVTHNYQLIKLQLDDTAPLIITTVKPIQYVSVQNKHGYVIHEQFENADSLLSLYGANLANSTNVPFVVDLDINSSHPQVINRYSLSNSSVSDLFIERRNNSLNMQYTNGAAYHAQNGVVLLSNLDGATQSALQTSISRADSHFAASSPFISSFGGNTRQNTILIGHPYLPGQFNNALVTVLEKVQYGNTNSGMKPGLWLDGRGVLTVSDEQDHLVLPDEFTVETWMKYGDVQDQSSFILRNYGDGAEPNFYLAKLNDGKLKAHIWNGSTATNLQTPAPITPGAWYHVAVTLKNNVFTIYLNGQEVDSATFSGVMNMGRTYPWSIGSSYINSIYSAFSGLLDEFRISSIARYTSNFTPPENPFVSDQNTLLLLHFSDNLIDSSPNNYQIIPFGVSEYTDDNFVPPSSPTPTITPTPTLPVAVFLEEFTAQWINVRQVRADWTTTSEISNLGFNIWRGATSKEPTVKLNKTIIPSCSPGGTQGCSYSYTDTIPFAQGGKTPPTYYYWIEDIDMSGTVTRHGPVGTDGSGGP